MTLFTSRLALPSPQASEAPNGPAQILALNNVLDPIVALDAQGTIANRPPSTPATPGVRGRYYFATDESILYRDNGTGWNAITVAGTVDGPAGTGTLRTLGTGSLQATAGNDGRLSNQRVPTDDSVTAGKVHTSLKPSTGAGGTTEALRALGTTAGTAAAGDDVRIRGLPTVVTALPGSPFDGQEVYFLADSANGVFWHLRYRAGSASAYKWEFLGGPEILVDGGAVTITTTGSNDGTYQVTSPSKAITPPLSGDYMVEIGGVAQESLGSSNQSYEWAISYAIGATAASDTDAAIAGIERNTRDLLIRRKRKTALSNANALTLYAKAEAGNGGPATDMYIMLRPIRVG